MINLQLTHSQIFFGFSCMDGVIEYNLNFVSLYGVAKLWKLLDERVKNHLKNLDILVLWVLFGY